MEENYASILLVLNYEFFFRHNGTVFIFGKIPGIDDKQCFSIDGIICSELRRPMNLTSGI
jgi:hypothetical protein